MHSQMDVLPSCVIFYNGGLKLACKGSALEDLKTLESLGVEIFKLWYLSVSLWTC